MTRPVYGAAYKNPLLALNIIIAVLYLVLIAPCIALMVMANSVPELKTVTGTISEWKNHDKDDPSFIDQLAQDTGSYFNIRLADGLSCYAGGEQYPFIDKALFSDISVGSEITVIYEDGGFSRQNDLYGIVYNGITYMDAENVKADMQEYHKFTFTICLAIIIGLTVVAIVSFVVNIVIHRRKSAKNANV